MLKQLKKYIPKLVTMSVGAAFLLHLSTASAGVSVLYPGAGNRPPKTPEWNVEQNRSEDTLDKYSKQGEPVKRINRSKKTAPTTLNVMLGENLASAELSADSGYKLLDGNEGKVLADFSANKTTRISVDGGKLMVDGKKINSRIITLKADNADSRVQYNHSFYRGTLQIVYDGRGIQILNKLSLEEYVKGVLPSEMSSSWTAEALKAQAVAARTFALYNKDKGHSITSGYDLCSSSHCQVYSGVAAETEAANKAVEATYGQVMQYDNKIIYAAFHSSSGGATENSEDVWGTYLPYLRSVTDDDTKSPYHNWSSRFTVEQLQKRLESSGKGVGKLQSVALSSVSAANDSVTGRSASGRAYGVKFTGSNGTVTLTGEQARVIFGLKSAMFNIRTERNVKLPTTKNSADTKSKNTKQDNAVAAAPNAMRGSAMKINGSETVVFDGHGFGHGLGMAQYGAKAMADKGSKYDAILKHYYTDIVLQEIY